jgi:dethiobiotin synthetase
MRYFVTGIGTDVGKTVVSAVLVEALKADYWKPIQSGYPRDLETVRSLVSNSQSVFWPEQHLLQEPASPHQAAHKEGISLTVAGLEVPTHQNDLIVEGAGGVMVPINNQEYMLDLLKTLTDETVVVIRLYLGCINHSLLTLDLLRRHEVKVKGIIFNGNSNSYSEQAILNGAEAPKLLHIPQLDQVSKEHIIMWANQLKEQWH